MPRSGSECESDGEAEQEQEQKQDEEQKQEQVVHKPFWQGGRNGWTPPRPRKRLATAPGTATSPATSPATSTAPSTTPVTSVASAASAMQGHKKVAAEGTTVAAEDAYKRKADADPKNPASKHIAKRPAMEDKVASVLAAASAASAAAASEESATRNIFIEVD